MVVKPVIVRIIRFFILLFAFFFSAPANLSAATVVDDILPLDALELRNQGLTFERGAGVKKDQLRAFRLYCLAAGLGEESSYYDLGWMRFNGRGVERDIGIAMGWFEAASLKGSSQAKNMLTRFDQVKPLQDTDCPADKSTSWERERILAWIHVIGPLFQVDPLLVSAVVEQESGFNPKALSPKNAQGLMQLIPQTADRFYVKDAWDPLQNMLAGVRYLRWLLQVFDGDVQNALAAYNAGENAVFHYKGIPPYRETQNYVKRIMLRYKNSTHPIPAKQVN